ncbi:MAG TPA: hypothetical protein ENI86_04330, partial [Acidimicrobiales bacterium]|nr:hypothetical protein [Acidimicrobiales bacterium]
MSLVLTVMVTVIAVVGALSAGWGPLLGLDLQGGVAVVLKPTSPTDSETIDQAIDIIRSRVDALGVAEPDITRQGDTIVVQLPGVKDAQRALDLVGQTAELRFRPVVATFDANDPQQRVVAQQSLEQTNGILDGATDQTTTTTAPGDSGASSSTTTTTDSTGATTTAPGDSASSSSTTADSSTTTVPDSTAVGDSTTTVPDSTAVGDSTTTVPDSTAVGDSTTTVPD